MQLSVSSKLELSVSSYNKALSCMRLYYIEKVLRYRDYSDKPWLQFGTAFDELMERADLIGVEVACKTIPGKFANPFKDAEAEYMLLKWQMKFGHDLQPPADIGDQKGNQYEIKIDLSDMVKQRFELIFIGYIDKVYMENGEVCINERKTTSDVINDKSVYWNRLLFDPQIVGYSFGLGYLLDSTVDNVTYEVFRKPNKAKMGKLFETGDSAEKYREKLLNSLDVKLSRDCEVVNRKKVIINDEMRSQWIYEFVSMAEKIHDAKVMGEGEEHPEMLWTRNGNACDNFLGCSYKAFCGCQSGLNTIENIGIKPEGLR